MIAHATQIISDFLNKEDCHFRLTEREDYSYITVGISVEGSPGIEVHLISHDDNNDVSLRVLGLFRSVSEKNQMQVLKVLNKLNVKYRFLKFVLDEDADISVEVDYSKNLDDESLGEATLFYIAALYAALKENYADIVKAVYGFEKATDESDLHKRRDFMRLVTCMQDLRDNPLVIDDDSDKE